MRTRPYRRWNRARFGATPNHSVEQCPNAHPIVACVTVLAVLGGLSADAAVTFAGSASGAVNAASPLTLNLGAGNPADCVVVFVETRTRRLVQ